MACLSLSPNPDTLSASMYSRSRPCVLSLFSSKTAVCLFFSSAYKNIMAETKEISLDLRKKEFYCVIKELIVCCEVRCILAV